MVVPDVIITTTAIVTVTGATPPISCVPSATSLRVTPIISSTLIVRLDKGDMDCRYWRDLQHRALLGDILNVDSRGGDLLGRATLAKRKRCHLLHNGRLVRGQCIDGRHDIG